MQMIQLLKQYGLLEEELNWPDIISIAENLYLDGHLRWDELQQIQDGSQPRKKAADMLLNIVLGNPSTVSEFMRILESESHLSYIAERINRTKISAEEMKNHPSIARMQTIRVLKQYGRLEEKLNWPDIISIAENLYMDEHLRWDELQQIEDRSQPRKKAADMLLNIVLGNPSTVSEFMRILESESHLSYIAESINRTKISAEEMENYPDACKWQKTRVQILKQFGWLKKEVDKSDVKEVANNLYNDGYLVLHELERILDSRQPRRKAIDLLLKKVILGNPLIVPAFMQILQTKSHLSFIAERISSTEVSPGEMHKRQSVGRAPSQMFHISDIDTKLLIENLYDEVVVDQINDDLLSNFFICIHDHNRIIDYSEVSKRVYELLELMKKCSDEVYNTFARVLIENKLEHVLQRLERNRILKKRTFSSTHVNDPSRQKHMRTCYDQQETCSYAEMQVVSALRRPNVRQKIGSQARRQLNLKFREAFSGSN